MGRSVKQIPKKYLIMLALLILALIWSGINPYRYDSWISIAASSLLYIIVIIAIHRKFEFTSFVYYLVFIQVIVFLIGAKYTYEYNPLFNSLRDTFQLNRNYFDRFAHITQGFVPFFLIKEYLLRNRIIKRSPLMIWMVIGVVMGLTALYELFEFAAAMLTKEPIVSPQGDPWDTHWDMVMALIGAGFAHIFFGKFHDRLMEKKEAQK